jgi:hypothetical protein
MINDDEETGEITWLDGGFYFKMLGEIYLKENNKFRAGECFVNAIEQIINQYDIKEFDEIVEEYELKELLEKTGYKHKAFSGWFGKEV